MWLTMILYTANAETITHNGVSYETVTSPYTGRIWLDRNLDAQRPCTDSYDIACTGGLYQWGRDHDGHQKSDSNTLRIQDVTSHINSNYIERRFITSPDYGPYDADWSNGIDEDGSIRIEKLSRTDGSFVCPRGFRVPTYQEFKLEYKDAVYSDARHF